MKCTVYSIFLLLATGIATASAYESDQIAPPNRRSASEGRNRAISRGSHLTLSHSWSQMPSTPVTGLFVAIDHEGYRPRHEDRARRLHSKSSRRLSSGSMVGSAGAAQLSFFDSDTIPYSNVLDDQEGYSSSEESCMPESSSDEDYLPYSNSAEIFQGWRDSKPSTLASSPVVDDRSESVPEYEENDTGHIRPGFGVEQLTPSTSNESMVAESAPAYDKEDSLSMSGSGSQHTTPTDVFGPLAIIQPVVSSQRSREASTFM